MTYELSEPLLSYYVELEPSKRLELLSSLPTDETTSYLRGIYENRYSDHEHKNRPNVDWWLWRCICLHQLYNKGKFFRSFRDREVNAIISELMMEDEAHSALLYHEYRNVARRYLSTCTGNYASSFMGFRKADVDEQAARATRDIWEMSRGIACTAGVEARMQIWISAFRDEVYEHNPLCRAEYEQLDRRIQ